MERGDGRSTPGSSLRVLGPRSGNEGDQNRVQRRRGPGGEEPRKCWLERRPPQRGAEDEASTGESSREGTRVAGRALSIGRCSPQTAWGHDPWHWPVQAGCVHKGGPATGHTPVPLTGTALSQVV